MKFVEPRPYADPEAAARKLMELANAFVLRRLLPNRILSPSIEKFDTSREFNGTR